MNQPVLNALVATAFAFAATPALAIDLMGAYTRAQSHDPTLAAARSEVLAGREKAVQGRSLLLPKVQLTATAARLSDHVSSSSLPPQLQNVIQPNGSGTVHEVAVQARQPIWAAQSRAEKQQLERQTELAEVKYRDAQQALMQRVAQTYLDVLLAEEHLRVARAEKMAVTQQRDRAQARSEVGLGRTTEVQESQARLDGVASRELQAESVLELRRAQFEELTGEKATTLAALRADFVPQAPQPDSAAAWQQQAMAGNLRVLFRQGELAIAGHEIAKYTLAARPTLDLVASASYRGQSGGLSALTAPDGKRSTMIGLQFSVPLFAGGAITSRERESVARRGQAEQDLAAAMRDARLQAQDAYLSVKTGMSRIGSLEQAVKSDATALEATMLGRDVGTRTELDVLDAQQRLYASQRDLAQARNEYLIGRIQLSAAAGALNEGDLAALNRFLTEPRGAD